MPRKNNLSFVRKADRPAHVVAVHQANTGLAGKEALTANDTFGSVAYRQLNPSIFPVMGDPENTFYDPNHIRDDVFEQELSNLRLASDDSDFVNDTYSDRAI